VETIGVGFHSLQLKEQTVCKTILSGLLESLYKNHIQHVAGAIKVTVWILCGTVSYVLSNCRNVCNKMRVLFIPRNLASLLWWLIGSKPCTAPQSQRLSPMLVILC